MFVQLGISIVAGPNDLFEGSYGLPVKFQISASDKSQSDRMINVNVSDGDRDFLRNSGLIRVRLPAGQTSVVQRYSLVDNDLDEPDGYITATVLPGEGYTVATTYNTARIKVRDNDGPPIVHVSPHYHYSSKWVEGHHKRITIFVI